MSVNSFAQSYGGRAHSIVLLNVVPRIDEGSSYLGRVLVSVSWCGVVWWWFVATRYPCPILSEYHVLMCFRAAGGLCAPPAFPRAMSSTVGA